MTSQKDPHPFRIGIGVLCMLVGGALILYCLVVVGFDELLFSVPGIALFTIGTLMAGVERVIDFLLSLVTWW